MQRIELTVEPNENRKRLEDLLCDRFRLLSKMYLREVVKTGACEVNGRHENIGHRLRTNDFIEITLDLSREHSMLPQNIHLDIVFEDDEIVVLNKPPGMLVHPSHREKNGTLLNALAFHLNQDPDRQTIRPGLVHRLDKETSGLIVVAKDQRSHRVLCRQFQRKTVEKRYRALVHGNVVQNEGKITGEIGRHSELKFWSLKEGGKASESRFTVIKRFKNKTLLELEPVTGRTNQLRIHCASIGHPIVGDKERGGGGDKRLCLHAARLVIRHPSTSEFMEFSSDADFS